MPLAGKKIIIPFNMRDGKRYMHTGKGNKQWLNTAPHGAGRIMSVHRQKSKYQWRILNSMAGYLFIISMRGTG